MSDLAPFVAAVLRDRVVEDLQQENTEQRRQMEEQREEIEVLRRTLHARNPYRSIQITGRNRHPVLAEDEFHMADEVPNVFDSATGYESIAGIRVQDFLQMELWIDGGRALRLQDLALIYWIYQYIPDSGYVARFDVTGDESVPGLLHLSFNISLPPIDHARLLCRDDPVELGPHADLGREHTFDDLTVGPGNDILLARESSIQIDLDHFLEVAGEKEVTSTYDWYMGRAFFVQYLTMPYETFKDAR